MTADAITPRSESKMDPILTREQKIPLRYWPLTTASIQRAGNDELRPIILQISILILKHMIQDRIITAQKNSICPADTS